MTKAEIQAQAREAANEMNSAMDEMHVAQAREKAMAERLSKEAVRSRGHRPDLPPRLDPSVPCASVVDSIQNLTVDTE